MSDETVEALRQYVLNVFGREAMDTAVNAAQQAVTAAAGLTGGARIITDPAFAGGARSGSDCTAAIQAALDSDAKVVVLPVGEFTVQGLSLNKAGGKTIKGQGSGTIIRLAAGSKKPVFMTTSGSPASDIVMDSFVVDCGWVSGQPSPEAIRFTNTPRATVKNCIIKNVGGAGIVAQGYSTSGKAGSPDLHVKDCVIDGAGLADGTTGFGVLVKDESPRAQVTGCRVVNVKGGMGIGANDTSLGAPVGMLVSNNTIAMVESTTNFEAIGLTPGCTDAVITSNVVEKTCDNGISASGSRSTVVGNTIRDTWNHGIAIVGTGTVVTGNVVLNVGGQNPAKGESLNYGGICLENPSGCVVTGNSINSPQNMAYGIKINGKSNGDNVMGLNSLIGFTISKTYGTVSGDQVT